MRTFFTNVQVKTFLKRFFIIIGIFIAFGGSLISIMFYQDYISEPRDGRKIYFLEDSDFSSGNWMLKCVNDAGYKNGYKNMSYLYLTDNTILNEYKNKMVIYQERDAYYTTPNYEIYLLKDGKQVKGCPLNHFDKINFGGLEKYLIEVKCRTFETYSKTEYEDTLSELKNKKEVMNINPKVDQTYKQLFEITIMFKEDLEDWSSLKKELAKEINESYGLENKVSDYFIDYYSTNNKYGIGVVVSIGFYDIEKFDLEKLKNLGVLKDKKVVSIDKQKKLNKYIIEYDEIIP